MPLCPQCLEVVSPALTCVCGWQAEGLPGWDAAAIRRLVREEMRRAADERALPDAPPARRQAALAYRAFGTGRS